MNFVRILLNSVLIFIIAYSIYYLYFIAKAFIFHKEIKNWPTTKILNVELIEHDYKPSLKDKIIGIITKSTIMLQNRTYIEIRYSYSVCQKYYSNNLVWSYLLLNDLHLLGDAKIFKNNIQNFLDIEKNHKFISKMRKNNIKFVHYNPMDYNKSYISYVVNYNDIYFGLILILLLLVGTILTFFNY